MVATPPATATAASPEAPASSVPSLELRLSPQAKESLRREPKRWVSGDLVTPTETLRNVSLRLKGHRSLRSIKHKPSFKLRVDRAEQHAGRRWLGGRGWTLENLIEDPSRLRAHLAYRLADAVGLPAPQTRFMTLTLNGEAKGLYLLVESPTQDFLSRAFEGADGQLYEGEHGCDLDDPALACFDLESGEDPGEALRTRMSELAAAEGAGLWQGEGAPFELGHLATFLAFGAYIGDFDGYAHAHNYRVYRQPVDGSELGRWWVMAWGLDRVFVEALPEFSGEGVLAARCFAAPDCRARYVRELQRIDEVSRELDLFGEVERLGETLERAEQAEQSEQAGETDTRAARRELQMYLSARHDQFTPGWDATR